MAVIFVFPCILMVLSPARAALVKTSNVPTDHGPVFGLKDTDTGLKYFYGVPYAKPPLGSLRWKDPVKPDPWIDPLDCTAQKPQCPQNICYDGLGCIAHESGDEDCLYMNIYVPPDTVENPIKPVAVYLHGGAFELGAASSKLYDGSQMALVGDVIVVVAAFRIGVLGSLVWNNDTEKLTGNYFIKDQRLMFQWIQKNIGKFGGDPNMVTAFGQSSGSQAIAIHSYTSASVGLFKRAFLMSFPAAMFTRSTSQMQRRGEAVVKHTNCTNVGCLRGKSASELVSAGNAANTGSNDLISFFQANTVHKDGVDVFATYIDAAKNSLFNPGIDYMISFTTGETIREAVLGITKPLADLAYRLMLRYWRNCVQCSNVNGLGDLLNNLLGVCRFNFFHFFILSDCPTLKQIYDKYKAGSFSDRRYDAANLMADFIYKCPINNVARNLARYSNPGKNVYVAKFAQPAPAISTDPCTKTACHALDLLYYFGTFESYPDTFNNTTPADYALSKVMICYFTNFVRTGDPNNKQNSSPTCQNLVLPAWNKFEENQSQYIVYKNGGTYFETNGYGDEFKTCPFWDGITYTPRRE